MGIDCEEFAIELTDAAKTHAEWLLIVRFGLGTLLVNQPLLMEVIVREATRECKRKGVAGRAPADDARAIIQELGLSFTTAPEAGR